MARKIEEESSFKKFAALMDQNSKGVQIGCYSIAFIGLAYALRRVRPFSRFKKPSDIPARFVKDHIELLGTVKRIEPNGILLIDHKPIISVPFVSKGELPTKIANIEINGHGVSWLQTLVADNDVKFIPISKKENFVECQIKLQQKISVKKEKTIDLGVSLVTIGFGNLIENPINTKDSKSVYYKQLEKARENALRKKMGIRYYVKPTKLVVVSILNLLDNIANVLLQKLRKRVVVPKAIAG